MLRVSRRSSRLRSLRLVRLSSSLAGPGDALVLLRGEGLRLRDREVDLDLDLELELRRRYLRDFAGGDRLRDSVDDLLRFRGLGDRDVSECEGDLRRGLRSGLRARPRLFLPLLRLSGDLDARLRGDGERDAEGDRLRRLVGERETDFALEGDLEGDLERDTDGLLRSSRLPRPGGTYVSNSLLDDPKSLLSRPPRGDLEYLGGLLSNPLPPSRSNPRSPRSPRPPRQLSPLPRPPRSPRSRVLIACISRSLRCSSSRRRRASSAACSACIFG
jgi:hypothetical protein